MKRILFVFCWSILSSCAMHAQVIPAGSKWFDGSVLYTAHTRAGGQYIFFDGISANEGGFQFTLERLASKKGQYKLIPSAQADDAPFRAQFNWHVQYVRQEGMYFLAVKNPKGDVVWTLTLTPDNIENCMAQEEWAAVQPVSELLTTRLMNTTYLSRFQRTDLQNMLKQLTSRKGKRSIIEETNISLLRSEIALSDDERYGVQDLTADGTPMGDIHYCANEQDFIAALGSNRTVYINDGLQLNLTPLLNEADFFTEAFGRAFVNYGAEGLQALDRPIVASEDNFDGRQLTLANIKNLAIVGGKGTSIVVEPRYAFVLNFLNCTNIRIENLTLGHTEAGYCDGGVVGLDNCTNVEISRCDMYGCGTYGIQARNTQGLLVQNSIIRDCSYGIMELHSTKRVTFNRCDFFRNREYSLIYADAGCEWVQFDDCRWWQNQGPLFSLDVNIVMKNCEVYHGDSFGSIDKIVPEAEANGNIWWFDKGPMLEPRPELGPQ